MPADLTLLLPLLILGGAALALLMLGAFTNSARATAVLAAVALAAAAYPLIALPGTGAIFPVGQASGAGAIAGHLAHFSPFTLVAALLLIGLALLTLPVLTQMPGSSHKPEVHVLLMLSLTGMVTLIASADLLTLYMGLELMSFPLYILAAVSRNDAKSSEAGLKYFVLGGFATGLTLYGISLLYAGAGTTAYLPLSFILAAPADPVLLIGTALTLLGVLFKLSTVPFHMWTPDVYEGAPTPITALFAALPKLAAVVLLIRLTVGPFAPLIALWQPALAVLAAVTMFVGAGMAVVQSNLKRLLAYSTIANVGFILTGVVAASPTGHGGALFYAFVYAVTTLGLFAALMASHATTVEDLKGLAGRQPLLAAAFMVLLFSLAGIPPFAGFMAKLGVFSAAVGAGYTGLAVVGVLASVIASFYSLWIIKTIYFDPPANPHPIPAAPQPLAFVFTFACLITVLLGLFPGTLANLTLAAATAVY